MSTGGPTSGRTAWGMSASTRMLLLTWVVIVVGGYVFQMATSQKTNELRKQLTSTQSSISDLERRIKEGDTSAIAELEAMRKQVADFDRVLAAQRDQFRLLSDRADEAKSRQAVDRAKVAVLQGEITLARERLLKLKTLHAGWTARQGSLLTGDAGRRIAGNAAQLELVVSVLDRERPSESDLVQWEAELDALAGPVQTAADGQSQIAITTEHGQLLRDLGQRLAKSVSAFEQQTLLVDAVLKETASAAPAATTLEQSLRERRTKADQESVRQLSAAREAARKQAEVARANELAKLEAEIVQATTRREADELRAKKAQAEQLGKAELERIAEETRVQEAKKKAETAGLKSEVTRVEASIKAAALEKEFERELPAMKGLLAAFLTDGFKYRNDNAKGPASFSYISSQKALEPTPTGSYSMAFLANSSDRPAGGLKNPASPEALRRAQDYLNKYGALLVEKGLLAP
jgi:hypothetical protein